MIETLMILVIAGACADTGEGLQCNAAQLCVLDSDFQAMETAIGTGTYNSRVDLNNDGTLDAADQAILEEVFGDESHITWTLTHDSEVVQWGPLPDTLLGNWQCGRSAPVPEPPVAAGVIVGLAVLGSLYYWGRNR